jgi:hypothetical protein
MFIFGEDLHRSPARVVTTHESKTRHLKDAFADMVNFSVDRPVEAQVEIMAALDFWSLAA